MFAKKKDPSRLDQAIDAVFDDMAGFTSETDEYSAMTAQLDRLYNLKACDAPARVSPDTIALVVGNIIGIVIIVSTEQKHIITSKALMFIQKMR